MVYFCPMHILYYITSHGYGHGVRSCAIMSALRADVRLTVHTSLPAEFLAAEIHRAFTQLPAEFDCGCIQRDSVVIDYAATVSTYSEIATRNAASIEQEVALCRDLGVDGIVSDATPFAFDVAARAGIPSIAATNFTWHDIYAPYVAQFPAFGPVVAEIRRQYASAGLLLALTPANPMSYFPHRKTVPLVGRVGTPCRGRINGILRLDPRKRLAIIYTGNFGIADMPWERLAEFDEWEFVGLYDLPGAPGNYRRVSKSDVGYADLLASADLVISKLGYATVAECMINAVPLLYLPREGFAEYPYLEAAVDAWGFGFRLSDEAYRRMEWASILDRVPVRARVPAGPIDGAAVCAREIEAFVRAG